MKNQKTLSFALGKEFEGVNKKPEDVFICIRGRFEGINKKPEDVLICIRERV